MRVDADTMRRLASMVARALRSVTWLSTGLSPFERLERGEETRSRQKICPVRIRTRLSGMVRHPPYAEVVQKQAVRGFGPEHGNLKYVAHDCGVLLKN